MNRIISPSLALALLLPLAATPCSAADFNGSTSESVYTGSPTSISYPVIMDCYFEPDDTVTRQTLVAMTDDGDSGLDGLVLEFRGDVSGDRIAATSWAAGSEASALTTTGSGTSTGYRRAMAIFVSDSERYVLDWTRSTGGGRVWRSNTSTIAAGDWSKLSIGSTQNGGGQNYFDGRIKQVQVYVGADASAFLADPEGTLSGDLRFGFHPIREQLILRESLGWQDNLLEPVESDVTPVWEYPEQP